MKRAGTALDDWQLDRMSADQLRDHVRHLQYRIEELEGVVGLGEGQFLSPELGLTAIEGRLLGVLLKAPAVMTKEGLLDALYGLKPDQDQPDIKIIDVFVCKVRKKIGHRGLKIETAWGKGYYIDAENKARLNALIADMKMAAGIGVPDGPIEQSTQAGGDDTGSVAGLQHRAPEDRDPSPLRA